jgi:hypothetical protein
MISPPTSATSPQTAIAPVTIALPPDNGDKPLQQTHDCAADKNHCTGDDCAASICAADDFSPNNYAASKSAASPQ